MTRFLAVVLVSLVPAASFAQIGQLGGDATPAFESAEEPAAAVEAEPEAAPEAAPAAEAAPAPAAPAATAPARTATEYEDERYVVDAAPSIIGATGLMRTYQATGLEPGTLGLSLQMEYFSGSDVVRAGDQARRFLGHIGLSWTPIQYFEAFATLSARAATNSLGDPELIQSVGDISFGGKGFYAFNDWFSVGALLNINMPAGANQVGLDLSATGADIVALSTFDLRGAADVPVRFNVNIGYRIDNQASLFPFVLDRVERFGQGVYDYDRVFLGLSVDAPLKYVTPFLEWTLEWPNGAQCEGSIEQQCVGEVGFASYPSFVTLGARSEAAEGLSFNIGVDLGVTTAESQGTPAVPGWNLLFGAAYNLNPRGTEVVEVPVEVPVEVGIRTSHVEGTVREIGTEEPIEGARISYLETDYTDQITGPDGAFRTFDFEPGTDVTIEITHPDYQPRAMRVSIAQEVLSGPIDMEPAFTGARVSGSVSVSGPAEITVSFRGAENRDVVCNEDGSFDVELEPGNYSVVVHAPGYASARESVELDAGRHNTSWTLAALSPDDQFRFTGDGFTFSGDTTRIAFGPDGALTVESQTLLDQVAGVLNAEGRTVLVRSHTDPRETIDEELELTATRADAVISYLVGIGVSADLLEADGVGSSEPLFPNVTDRNRRQNNRIEFQFID